MLLTLEMLTPLPVYRDEIVGADSLATRLDTLEGRVIGLLPNWRPSAFDLLKALGEVLKERCGVAEIVLEQPTREVPVKKGRLLDGMDAQLDDLARRVDAVITATGD
ncbi:MAG: hypothetical protein JWN13_5351 [Betaproteobacteria bacterium]|nr:hypothetical protein [Betaproteobacteria bacterium]